MSGEFDGKLIVVTGGGQGLGAATCHVLARAGALEAVRTSAPKEPTPWRTQSKRPADELSRCGSTSPTTERRPKRCERPRSVTAASSRS